MKSSVLLALIYQLALPGYRFEFPRDFFNHPEYRTEWWYYTGNLHARDGHRFGFELTFFRQGVDREKKVRNVWDVEDVWLAHLALSDLDGGRFLHTERLNRAGAGVAGADAAQARVWNGNWQVRWSGGAEKLQAVAERFQFQLDARPVKAPVVHGLDGVSQKSAGAGNASHYFSETRLDTRGRLTLDGKDYEVEGLSWMDHEFFSGQASSTLAGWDWFSLQLEDGSELMLYRLRRRDGSVEPFSSGTYVDAQGRSQHLGLSDFRLTPGKTWQSPATGGKYPVEWGMQVPSLGVELALRTGLADQELAGGSKASPSYWEGSIEVSGKKEGRPVKGTGYLEMTGYAGAIDFGG
jgi:predicted secreted hydrolase